MMQIMLALFMVFCMYIRSNESPLWRSINFKTFGSNYWEMIKLWLQRSRKDCWVYGCNTTVGYDKRGETKQQLGKGVYNSLIKSLALKTKESGGGGRYGGIRSTPKVKTIK